MQSFIASHQHLYGLVMQEARQFASLALLIAIFGPLERLFAVRQEKFLRASWPTELGWFVVNGLAPAFLLGFPLALIAAAIHQVLPASVTGAAATWPLWLRMCAAMVVGEIGFYWGHRWSHEIPFLWRFHAIHHRPTQVNFMVNTRAHPVDQVFTRLCGLVLLYATGLASPVGPHPTLIPALVLFVGSMWSYLIHANVRWRLGPLEEILSSPAFHHWHHTLEDHKDRNYASMLPVLDRVFGTFYLPKHWPEAYGTDTPMSETIAGQLLDPFMPPKRAPATAPVKAQTSGA